MKWFVYYDWGSCNYGYCPKNANYGSHESGLAEFASLPEAEAWMRENEGRRALEGGVS